MWLISGAHTSHLPHPPPRLGHLGSPELVQGQSLPNMLRYHPGEHTDTRPCITATNSLEASTATTTAPGEPQLSVSIATGICE